jgi:putative glycosyltransferase (TIGR04372 family)
MFNTKAYALVRPAIRAVLPAPARAKLWALLMYVKNIPIRLIVALHTSLGQSVTLVSRYSALLGESSAQLLPHVSERAARAHEKHNRTAASTSDLRRQLEQAIASLDRLDIAGCVNYAMPAATLECPPGDIERLRIKEEACYLLAVALLQGLGCMDEAIFWWREQQRLTALIGKHLLWKADTAYDPRELVFDWFWSAHVGHTSMLGLHVKRNLLEGETRRALTLVRPPQPNAGNNRLVDYWQRYFTLVERPAEPAALDYLRYGSKGLFLDARLPGPETYFWPVFAEISRAWELAGGGALLELAGEDLERGRLELAAMGVPRGAWYVCLHVRASGFKRVHEGLQSTLNADVGNYDLAIDAIVERGGWVIRMGDPSMPRLPARKGVIDYAHSPHKADWMDLFLCGTCRFYIGTSSGLAYVPNLFGTPSVFTNWFPTGTRPLNGGDIYIPKMHWYDLDGEFAPFAESLAPPLGHIHVEASLRALGVALRENTREDLRDVVVEMLDRVENRAAYTADDDQLQARFDVVARNSRCFGNARIGRDFLRKHRRLLPGKAGPRELRRPDEAKEAVAGSRSLA